MTEPLFHLPDVASPTIADLPADDHAMTEVAARRLCDQLNARLTRYHAYPHHPKGHEDMSLLRQGWVVRLHPAEPAPVEVDQPMSCEDVELFAHQMEEGE